MWTDSVAVRPDARVAEGLWEVYRVSRSDEARNALVMHYLSIAHFNALAMLRRMPSRVEREDVFQSAFFGLKDAIAAFDPARGVKFESYCVIRVRGSILDGLRAMLAAPREVRQKHQKVEQARDRMQAATGRPPTELELAEALRMPVEEFGAVSRHVKTGSTVDLHGLGSSNIGVEAVVDGLRDAHSPDPVDEMQRSDLKGLIMQELGETERRLLVMYYYEDMTMREIARALVLSESRVSQIHGEVVGKLRGRLAGRLREASGRRGLSINL